MQSGKNSAVGAHDVEYAVLHTKLDYLIKLVGEKDSAGTGGTGLAGEIARNHHEAGTRLSELDKKIDHLYSLKHVGVGLLIALGGTAVVLLAGVKSILADWLK